MHQRWAGICYDFRERYLSFDYVKHLIDKKIDPLMKPVADKDFHTFIANTIDIIQGIECEGLMGSLILLYRDQEATCITNWNYALGRNVDMFFKATI